MWWWLESAVFCSWMTCASPSMEEKLDWTLQKLHCSFKVLLAFTARRWVMSSGVEGHMTTVWSCDWCTLLFQVELLHSLVYQTLEYISDRNKKWVFCSASRVTAGGLWSCALCCVCRRSKEAAAAAAQEDDAGTTQSRMDSENGAEVRGEVWFSLKLLMVIGCSGFCTRKALWVM